MDDPRIDDEEPAHMPGDEEVDWSRVDEVAAQVDRISRTRDPGKRLDRARVWAAALGGE